MLSESPWRRMSSVWCHTYVPGERWMQWSSRLQKLLHDGKTIAVPHAFRKVILCPLRGEGKLQLKGCWDRHSIEHRQICQSKILTGCCSDRVSNFNTNDYWVWGTIWWDQRINVPVIHHGAPVMDWMFASSQNLYVEVPTPKVTWGYKGGALIL